LSGRFTCLRHTKGGRGDSPLPICYTPPQAAQPGGTGDGRV
jgi:hypothetical protein